MFPRYMRITMPKNMDNVGMSIVYPFHQYHAILIGLINFLRKPGPPRPPLAGRPALYVFSGVISDMGIRK